jgi:hypothetical protein
VLLPEGEGHAPGRAIQLLPRLDRLRWMDEASGTAIGDG